MSLQVWLPLNGNLNNQGLSEVTVANSGATIDSNGKIGSCYSFDTGKYLTVTKPATITKEISYSCWVNISSWNSITYDCILSIATSSNWRDSRATLCRNGGSTNLTWNIANGSSRSYVNSNTSLSLNTWYHIACTYDGAKLRIYINGVEDNSVSTSFVPNYGSAKLYIGSWNGNNYNLKGRLNDVRVYDHCLSAKEVKEISKGLICHYKLDNNGFGGENLILESHRVTSGGGASGITSAYMNDGSLKVVATSGNGGWKSCGFSKDSNPNVGSKLSVGDTYTISLDVKIEEGNSLPSLFINEGNAYRKLQPVNGKIVTNSWFRAYYTSTWNEPGTSYGNISIHLWFGGVTGTFYFKNFKLEKGSKPTQWCPSPLDDNTLGLDSATESDCSGYKNDGNKIGNVLPSSEPGRYSTSTYCNSTNIGTSTPTGAAYIRCTLTSPIKDATALTINWWGNVEEYGYQASGILSLSNISSLPSDHETSALAQYDSTFRFNLTDGGYSSISSETLIERGNWHMYTLVFNNGAVQGYRDGVSIVSSSKSGTLAQFAYVYMGINAAGKTTRKTKSKWSDFRIYSTALSASDVKELYNTSASVDKNGNMYAYEFKEE